MKLRDTESCVFELFYHWLYSQALWNKAADRVEWPDTDHLMKLYVFTDMAKVISLKNQVMDTVHAINDALNNLPLATYPYVWENTASTDPIRTLMVDWLVWESAVNCLECDAVQKISQELSVVVMKGLWKAVYKYHKSGVAHNSLADLSRYHQTERNNIRQKYRVHPNTSGFLATI